MMDILVNSVVDGCIANVRKIVSLLAILAFLDWYSCERWLVHATGDNDNSVEAEKLLQQAEQLTDIRSPGSHAFRLAARVKLFDEKGESREGKYNLLWESPTVWKDELRFADFIQLRVAQVDKLFVIRDPPSLLLEFYRVLKLVDFPNRLRVTPNAKAQQLRSRTRHGSRERTIEMALPGESPWKMIVLEESSPIPTRIKYKGGHYEYQFENYVAFNGHQFPRTLIELESNKPLTEVQVEELAEAAFDASAFIPPPAARWLSWCPHPIAAKILEPEKGYIRVPPGRIRPVAIYGIIGTDGQWHNLAAVKSGGKELDSYLMTEMVREHYSPARCGEAPVEEEIVRDFPRP